MKVHVILIGSIIHKKHLLAIEVLVLISWLVSLLQLREDPRYSYINVCKGKLSLWQSLEAHMVVSRRAP
jgi:hypothetical protein